MEYNEFINWIKDRNRNIGEFSTQAEFLNGPNISVSADGVGTKLLVAKELNKFDTIGIDLVAMNVNDIIADGYIPFGFSNYIACGSVKEYLKDIIIGIEEGCRISNCKLMGGETAIMPDIYGQFDFDLGGFAIGYSNDKSGYPKKYKMKDGNLLFGIPSSGLHSNGFTLARKILPNSFYEEMLTPTKIYTELIKEKSNILGMAHITGDGFNNINRILPDKLKANIKFYNWDYPKIFHEIFSRSDLSMDVIRSEFNLGIGMVLVVEEELREYFNNKDYIEIGYLSKI